MNLGLASNQLLRAFITLKMAKAIDRSRYEHINVNGESQAQHGNHVGESTGGGAHA